VFGARSGADEICGTRLELRNVFLQRGPEAPPDPIAGDGVAHDPTDGKCDAGGFWSYPDHRGSHFEIPGAPTPAACQRLK
jgi:hypothetical protein